MGSDERPARLNSRARVVSWRSLRARGLGPETTCAFQATRRAGRAWTMSALCSDGRGQWKTKVKPSVPTRAAHLDKSKRIMNYVRCGYGPVLVDWRALKDRLIEASRA